MSLQQTNQRGLCAFVPPANSLYQTAINVSLDQVIKPSRFVCFISRLPGRGNSDTHTRVCVCVRVWTHTHTHANTQRRNCCFIHERFFFFSDFQEKSLPLWYLSLPTPLKHFFIFSSSCGKTQLHGSLHYMSVVAIGDCSHVLLWCRRHESVFHEAASRMYCKHTLKNNIASTY